MKTAIIGLPMVGKTSLFTILTGVHESARIGSLEARVGVTKCRTLVWTLSLSFLSRQRSRMQP